MFTVHTFNNMQKEFIKVIDGNLSFEDLTLALKPYDEECLLRKYFYAKYYYRHEDYNKASELITEVVFELAHNGLESATSLTYFNKALLEIYGIAGEIYAHNNQYDNSLYAYQDHHICLLRLKEAESTSFLSFRRYNEYTLADLIHNEITVVHPSEMNDPYDTLLLKWSEYLAQEKTVRKHIGPYCDALASYRIRSFTKLTNSSNQDMVCNTLMWSHYTTNHTGFCIKYSFSKEFTSGTEERRTIRFKDIIYHDENSPLDITTDSIDTNKGLCTKQSEWAYENEVRMIAYEPEIEGKYHAIPLDRSSKIESIYFGYKCPNEHIRTIRKIVTQHYPDAKFYKMSSDFTNIYCLKAEEI